MPSTPQYGLQKDVANSRVALNYAGTRRFSVNSSGASVNGTLATSGATTASGDITATDDVLIAVGTGSTARVSWDTTDANANAMLVQLPAGGAVDVPVIAIGQSIESVDLGLYDGVVDPRVAMFGVGAVTTGPVLEFRKARGTIASPTVVTSGDDIGNIDFYGAVAAGEYVRGASIQADMAGTIATTRGPGTLTFKTATDAAPSVLTTALTISAAQLVTCAAGVTVTTGNTTLSANDAAFVAAAGNVKIGNPGTFGTTQPRGAVVMGGSSLSGIAPAGSITTAGAIFASDTVVRKIIADGTASNVET